MRGLPKITNERVLVGTETNDDAGVYLLQPGLALVQTVDFFTPIVDDPYDYGQIAAANSLSDVYAMGGTPVSALNILGYPVGKVSEETVAEILRGGGEKVIEAGAALLGGHSVDDPEMKFGLAVTGVADPDRVVTNKGARAGDYLILTKALGTGIITQALKRDEVDADALAAAVASMKQLNAAASRAMVAVGVSAATDITGFGLLGHLYEMLDAAGVGALINARALPILPGALQYSDAGIGTGGARRNRAYLEPHLRLKPSLSVGVQGVLFDPQTSGGLLIAVRPERAEDLLDALIEEDVAVRAVIGSVEDRPREITVSA